MARIPLVTSERGGIGVKLAFFFTRRGMRTITGRETAGMLEPLQVYAHVPVLMKGYGQVEQATAKSSLLDRRHRYLAELKAATMTNCEFCIDMGSQVVRQAGVLSDEELLALPGFRTSPFFDTVDKLVLEYAVAMSNTPVEVPDALFAGLRDAFSDPQIVELTHVIALENHRGRFNLAMGIGASGFSDGLVCAVPTRHAAELA